MILKGDLNEFSIWTQNTREVTFHFFASKKKSNSPDFPGIPLISWEFLGIPENSPDFPRIPGNSREIPPNLKSGEFRGIPGISREFPGVLEGIPGNSRGIPGNLGVTIVVMYGFPKISGNFSKKFRKFP